MEYIGLCVLWIVFGFLSMFIVIWIEYLITKEISISFGDICWSILFSISGPLFLIVGILYLYDIHKDVEIFNIKSGKIKSKKKK